MLQKNPHLRSRLETFLAGQLENGLYKAKPATRIRWNNLPVLECRLNDPAVKAIRFAFALGEEEATVLYLSNTLLKKDFTREIEKFLREGGA